MRQQGDLIRSVYPKLILEGGNGFNEATGKMLALIKQDMSPNQNEWAWYGYQVSMRILEVTLCTLLAIIATTPLRYDQIDNGLEASPGSTLDEDSSCCFGSKRNRHRSR